MRSCQSWSKLPYGAGVRTTFKMPVLWLLKVSLLLLLQELYEWMTVKGRIEFLWHDEMFSPKHSDCVVWARVEHSSNIDNVFSSCFDTSQTESTDQTHLQISQLHCIAMLQLICHQYNAKYCLFFSCRTFYNHNVLFTYLVSPKLTFGQASCHAHVEQKQENVEVITILGQVWYFTMTWGRVTAELLDTLYSIKVIPIFCKTYNLVP